ncbi:MAG: hypothetical protein ABL893_07120, partial [Hyphomicrobium sp.]
VTCQLCATRKGDQMCHGPQLCMMQSACLILLVAGAMPNAPRAASTRKSFSLLCTFGARMWRAKER